MSPDRISLEPETVFRGWGFSCFLRYLSARSGMEHQNGKWHLLGQFKNL